MQSQRMEQAYEDEYASTDIGGEVAANRATARELRLAEARRMDAMRRDAESRMRERTRLGRKYEEHRCGMAPYGWRLRRYAAPTNPAQRDMVVPYVWVLVRTEPPDDWLDGYECSATLNGVRDEPRFCPWCGAHLDRCPDELRGWRP